MYCGQYCWGRGGYLAEITSAEEELALEGVLMHGKEYWLGLTDVEEQGYGLIFQEQETVCICMS